MLESIADNEQKKLQSQYIATPLGSMFAVASENAVCFLAFTDCKKFEREVERLQQVLTARIVSGASEVLMQLERELQEYFAGSLQEFTIPLQRAGTPFQERVWHALQQIPYGTTCSYAQLAKAVGNPTACRAVALANSVNRIALVIPCHRVINADGKLGGYAGRAERKQWLIEHEKGV